jgi:hypothetical protein
LPVDLIVANPYRGASGKCTYDKDPDVFAVGRRSDERRPCRALESAGCGQVLLSLEIRERDTLFTTGAVRSA